MEVLDTVKPEGDLENCEVMIIGGHATNHELQICKPFTGPAGYVLDECLRSSGIPRAACYLTHVFPFKTFEPKGSGKIFRAHDKQLLFVGHKGARKVFLSEEGAAHVHELKQKVLQSKANIIIAMGAAAAYVLTGQGQIMNWRGSVLPCTFDETKKVMITLEPFMCMHQNFINRYLMRWDLKKIWQQRNTGEVIDNQYEFILNPGFNEAITYLKHLKQVKAKFACDIEVARRQCSRITFNTNPVNGMSIAYGDGDWTAEEEAELWRVTADLLEDLNVRIIWHNAAFDSQFLFMIHHIMPVENMEDTMLGHHIIYTDFPKGLYFLGSLYTDQPFWKQMVNHNVDIEKEDG